MRRILILLVAVPALAGCGGGGKPLIEPGVAGKLAQQADAVAAGAAKGDACGASRHAVALQAATIRAINAHAIPLRFQEPLLSRANELVSELQASCLPSPAAAPPTPVPAPAPVLHGRQKPHGHPPKRGHEHDHGGHGHGKGH